MNVNTVSPDLLLASTPTSHATGKASKLHDAAQQFESLMINEMLKSVRETSSGGWLGSDENGDSGQDSAMEMAEAQFSAALAKSGGLGLSRVIENTIAK